MHETVETAAERFLRADRSYRFQNRFRYLIAAVPRFDELADPAIVARRSAEAE